MAKRVVIGIKDVSIILDKSYRQSQREHKKIKEHFGLSKSEYLSLSNFCIYTKIPIEEVEKALKTKN